MDKVTTSANANQSPFHLGEQEIQSHVGAREKMEVFGSRVIRSFLLEQHQDFFSQLPFLVIGSVDQDDWPWASILPGTPGFTSSPDSSTLKIDTVVSKNDPLSSAIKLGQPLGLLGIEQKSRRRNRLNAHVSEVNSNSFSLKVDQSFGNCPKYIQTRSVDFIRDPKKIIEDNEVIKFTTLDDAANHLIRQSDTFFVSSYIQTQSRPDIEGVDVSHRGGKPGFVKIKGNTLTIPDYSGNNHFNTLGNFLMNPKAGLIFSNFDNGEILMLTGSVEILWEDEPEVIAFNGAQRAWRFTLDHGIRVNNALPFRSTFNEYSPKLAATGDWSEMN